MVDPETGAEVPTGEIGELQLRGGALMSGMYKRLRSEVFTPDGFYPTGDLVRIDADDCLYFIARRNAQFGRAGYDLKQDMADRLQALTAAESH